MQECGILWEVVRANNPLSGENCSPDRQRPSTQQSSFAPCTSDRSWGYAYGVDARKMCVYETMTPLLLTAHPDARHDLECFTHVRSTWPLTASAMAVLLSTKMAALACNCLGVDACFLFNEQYIIKESRSGVDSSFEWHRDGEYMDADGQPVYISIWCALDDMTRDNGCLVVRPGSHHHHNHYHCYRRKGSKEEGGDGDYDVKHEEDKGRKNCHEVSELDLVIKKGSVVVMSNTLLHKSGINTTAFQRRAWMPQFSKHPIRHASSLSRMPHGEHSLVSLAVKLQRSTVHE